MQLSISLTLSIGLISSIACAADQGKTVPPPMPPVPTNAIQTAATANFKTCDRPKYPAGALREERTGATDIQFLISVEGKVKETRLKKSSGHADLDEAAMSALSVCDFKPGTRDGAPAEMWTNVRYVWKIETPPVPVALNREAVLDLRTCARPIYPRAALREGRTGTSQLSFTVSADGAVKSSEVQVSSGHSDLDRAALSALSKCHFQPAIKDGKPIETSTNLKYVWSLKGSKQASPLQAEPNG